MYSTCKLVKLLQLYNSTIYASKQELEFTDALDSNYQLHMHPNNNIGIEEYFHFHPALALLAQCNSSAPIPTSKRSIKVFCRSIGTKLMFASVYHPQSNGAVERANGVIFTGI